MSTYKLYCSGDTYTDWDYKEQNYGSAQELKMVNKYIETSNGSAIFKGYSVTSRPVLQYNLNTQDLKYKKISAAKLYLYINSNSGNGFYLNYLTNNVALIENSLNYSNYHSYFGNYDKEELGDFQQSSGWISIDITDLVVSNLNNVLTFIIEKRTGSGSAAEFSGGIASRESINASYIELEYEAIFPNPPTLDYPVDIYISENKNINFSWTHNSLWGGEQTKFQLEWKEKSGSSWNIITQNTSINNYTMSAGIIPAGIIEWRLKTADQSGTYGEYSTANFTIIGKPETPIIYDVKNDALTEIFWNSEDQDVAEIQILKNNEIIYEEKNIIGAARSIKPDVFLDNGNYIARVRIMSIYNEYSNWGNYSFIISADKPEKPNILVSNYQNKGILVQVESEAEKLILYRIENEVEIPIFIFDENKQYIDYAVNTDIEYQYFVRAYERGFLDSDKKIQCIHFDGILISSIVNLAENVNINLSLEEYINLSKNVQLKSTLINYVGRKYPVRETSEYINNIFSVTGYISREEYKRLENIFYQNNIILLRTKFGEKIFCDFSNMDIKNEFFDCGYEISFSVTQIEYNEEVEIRD